MSSGVGVSRRSARIRIRLAEPHRRVLPHVAAAPKSEIPCSDQGAPHCEGSPSFPRVAPTTCSDRRVRCESRAVHSCAECHTMRVLTVHNRYSSRTPSGENLAVEDEARWLAEAGVDVVQHLVSNDVMVDVGPVARVRDGLGAVWSVPARRRFARVLDEARPDVVHVHNLFPLLTASVPAAAARAGVPVVWTVHNRRVGCVAGGNFRDGHPCHACRTGWRAPGIVHRCYAESRTASALVTAATALFRREAVRDRVVPVDISESMADWLASLGAFD